MRALVSFCVGIGFLVFSCFASAQTLLVMGDSLSAAYGIPLESGWVNLLAQRMQKDYASWQVVNASISGETTSGGRSRFSPLLEQYKPDLVIVELGANDGLRGLPLTDMESNLRSMIADARKTGANVILFAMKLPPNYGVKFTERFERVYSTLAAEQQVELQAFFLQGVAGQPELTQADGLHPVASAQPVILENVWPLVARALNTRSAKPEKN